MPQNITVQKILAVLLNRIKFIIVATIAMAVVFFGFSKLVIKPTYTTSAMIYVQNYSSATSGVNDENQKIYSSDISGSSTLANICVTLFQNSDDLTALYDGCNVSMNVADKTFFITVTVTSGDAKKCANVANKVCDKAKDVFTSHFQYGQLGSIRKANVPSGPISPSNSKYGLIGFAVGLVGSCVIAILLELIDTTIKFDDDIQKIYGLPVFAEIPDFDSQT